MTEPKQNAFAKKNETTTEQVEPVTQEPASDVEVTNFSSTALQDKKKYERPNLDGKEDVVDKIVVFRPDTTQEPQLTMSKKKEYWPVKIQLFYTSKNEDGIQNHEYISGAKIFKNENGKISDINFYYEGSNSQVAYLWEFAAKSLGKEPLELDPTSFVEFYNSHPRVKLAYLDEIKSFKVKNPQTGVINSKNMPVEFLKA